MGPKWLIGCSPSAYIGSVLTGIFHDQFSIFLTENVASVTFCDIWCDNCGIERSLKKTFHNPFSCDNSGVLRKCHIWDIISRSPFVSMKDISRLFRNLEERTSVRGKRKMDYGLWDAPVRTDPESSD